MKKFHFFLKLVFAANALSFAILLCFFIITLFIFGIKQADNIWKNLIFYIIAWCVSIPICVRYLDKR